jgi:hypothetical protein
MISKFNRSNKRIDPYKLLLTISVMGFFCTLGFRIHCASNLAVKNEELKNLDDQKSSLEKEVALLEYEDSKYSSLKNVEDAAYKLGYIKAADSLITVDLSAGSPVAVISK